LQTALPHEPIEQAPDDAEEHVVAARATVRTGRQKRVDDLRSDVDDAAVREERVEQPKRFLLGDVTATESALRVHERAHL